METENRQVYSQYGMIFMLGGLWAVLNFYSRKAKKL